MKKPKMPVQRGPRLVTDTDRLHWRAAQALYAELLEDLDEEFTRAGIEYMPIKGAYLIKAGLAPTLDFREMDDIDILVRERDFARVVEHFRASDKATLHEDKWFFEQPLVYKARGITGRVEVNFLLNRRERFLLETDELFDRSVPDGEFCRLPSPEDAALITICHVLVHIAWTIRESAFREVEVISGQEGFSWEKFWMRAERTGVRGFVVRYLRKFRPKGRENRLPTEVYSGPSNLSRYYRLSVPMRRLLWELTYVRKPFALALKSLRNTGT